MAVTLDATSSVASVVNQSAGGTTSLAHTVGSGATVLIVSLQIWNNGSTAAGASGVTYNGVSMTKATNQTGSTGTATGFFYVEQWYLASPATGTNNIIVTVGTKTDKLGIAGVSFTGSDTTTPIDVSSKTFGTTGTYTQSLTTTAAGEYLVDSMCHLSANNPTSNTGTLILNSATSGTSTASQYKIASSAGSNSTQYIYPDIGDEGAYCILAVKAAGGGGGGISNKQYVGFF
jgi:hypothetical protein